MVSSFGILEASFLFAEPFKQISCLSTCIAPDTSPRPFRVVRVGEVRGQTRADSYPEGVELPRKKVELPNFILEALWSIHKLMTSEFRKPLNFSTRGSLSREMGVLPSARPPAGKRLVAHPQTKNPQTRNLRDRISGRFPMDPGIPSLKVQSLAESDPLTS